MQVCNGSAENAALCIEKMRKSDSKFNLNQITSGEPFDFVYRDNPRHCGAITDKDENRRDIIHSCFADYPSCYRKYKDENLLKSMNSISLYSISLLRWFMDYCFYTIYTHNNPNIKSLCD